MTALILHDYFRSSASFRVRIALNLKGLDYERVEVSLIAGEQKSDAYLAQNAQGFVPMLVADGEPIIQSLAIIDWLDRAFPEPRLIPDDAMPRAVALAQAYVVACDIHPLNNLRVLKYLTRDLGLNEQTKDRWIHEWILQGFDALDRKFLFTIIDKFDGGPVGIESIAAAIGEERGTLEDVIEPFLIQSGLFQRTPRGRYLTERGWRHIGLEPPASAAQQLDLLAREPGPEEE